LFENIFNYSSIASLRYDLLSENHRYRAVVHGALLWPRLNLHGEGEKCKHALQHSAQVSILE